MKRFLMDFFYHYLLTKQNGFPNSIFVVKSFFHNYINFESCYLVKSFISENIKFISFKKTQRIIFLTCHIKCHVQWETIFLFEIFILKIIIKTFSPFCRLFSLIGKGFSLQRLRYCLVFCPSIYGVINIFRLTRKLFIL